MNELTISTNQRKRYDALAMPELLRAILANEEEGKTVLGYVLYIRLREPLEKEYYSFVESVGHLEGHITFDDCLSQLYMTLWKGHPVKVREAESFHYLRTILDAARFAPWVKNFFQNQLKELRKAKESLIRAIPEIEAEKRTDMLPDLQISLHRIAYSMAKFNQEESAEARYLLFRSLRKDVVRNYVRLEELSDQETAEVMDIKYTSFRSKVSRNCQQLRRYITSISHQDILMLNASSLNLVNRMVTIDPERLGDVVMDLMDQAERELPCYQQIVDARSRKVEFLFVQHDEGCACFMSPCESAVEDMVCDNAPVPSISPSFMGVSLRSKKKLRKKQSPICENQGTVSLNMAICPDQRELDFLHRFVENFTNFLLQD